MDDALGTNEKLLRITFYVLGKYSKTITADELVKEFNMTRRTAGRLLATLFYCQDTVNGLTIERVYLQQTGNPVEYTFEYRP